MQELKEIFLQACALPKEQRASFLDLHCGNDAKLRAAVEELLHAHDSAGQFLAGPTLNSSAAQDPAPAAPLRQIGPYQLLEIIGEGGFGVVYLAEQQTPVRRRVALKLIKAGMDTKEVIARFDAERQALAMMEHPNIARVFDAGATELGHPYFVMELVSGVPITQYCDMNRLSTQQRLELFVPVCQAVQHAHQKGIIHRDLKPTNVLISLHDGQPVPKVIDFGIAKATQSRLTEKTLFTEMKQLIGTPEYMSPEQAEAPGIDIDTRSDIYSLGVLLYELLTGSTPFDPRELRRQAYAEMQRLIREVDPPRPSTRLSTVASLPSIAAQRSTEPRKLSATIRGELDWIVMKCLEKDRARRYDSASALAGDLLHYLADEPVTAAAPSRLYRLRKLIRRNKGPVLASMAVVLALIAGIIGTTIGLISASRQRAIAQQEREEARRQAREANQQADIALAVSKFQKDMLSSADPMHMLGEKVTVLDAIAGAVKQIEAGQFSQQPLVEAQVRLVIGDTLRTLGRYNDAERHLRKALELRRSALPAGSPGIAYAMTSLAALLENQSRLPEAESLYRESLEIWRRELPAGDTQIGWGLAAVSGVVRLQGKPHEAEPLAREALSIMRKSGDARKIVPALNDLALIYRAQEQYPQAEVLLREAIQLNRATLGPAHPELARAMGNLAIVLQAQEKRADAEALYREVLEIQRKSLPAQHPDTTRTVSNLGWLLLEDSKPQEAEPLFREAMADFEHSFGPGHWIVANTRMGLGSALCDMKQFSRAEPELLGAELTMVKVKGIDPKRHRHTIEALVELYRSWDAAEPGKGFDAKARQWQARLPSTQPTSTQPATTQTTP
jgi:serine/threonine protein kinase